jgi:hypothetical protein
MTEQKNFKGRSTNDQYTHEEMYISGHKGIANQNYIKISLYSSRNGYHQEHKQQQMLVRMWENETPYTLLVGM